MKLHVPINEDVISVLDRVLDRGIVVDSWVHIGPRGAELTMADASHSIVSSSVYIGYAGRGGWRPIDELRRWFPFRHSDLWSK